jgi:hypothetical protein
MFFCQIILVFSGFLVVQARAVDEPPTELYVRTTPEGAKVFLDDKEVGVTPDLFKVEPGKAKIVVKLEGRDPVEREVEIHAYKITRLELEFKNQTSTAADDRDKTTDAKKVHVPCFRPSNSDVGVVLDFASGQLLKLPDPKKGGPSQFTILGKGDLVFGQNKIVCLRGGTIMRWNGTSFIPYQEEKFGEDEKKKLEDAKVYVLPTAPCRLLITTAEKKQFDVTILSIDEDGGIDLEYRPADAAKAEPDPNVVEGVGWGAFRVGATRKELVKAVGEPDTNPTPQTSGAYENLQWLKQYHIDCMINANGPSEVINVRFNKGFELPLSSGVKIGSPEKDVLMAYGLPSRVQDRQQSKRLSYVDRGVALMMDNGKVRDFTVFKLRVPVPVGQSSVNSEAQASNILKNFGFESGDKTPDDWNPGLEIEGVKYSWNKEVAFEGKASLCIEKTAQRYFPIAEWSQTVERQGDRPVLLVSSQVKAQKMTKAILDVIFLDENGTPISHKWAAFIGIKEPGEKPANHDWQLYSGKVEIPTETKKLSIGLQVYGPGKVWFDNVRASYADQPAPNPNNILKNPGFEDGVISPDNWEQGADIEGVKYSWDKKVAIEGKASVCIEKTAKKYFPIAEWSQTVERTGDKPALMVSAQVKAKKMTKAILDVAFLDENAMPISHEWVAFIGIKETGDKPADHDWKLYSGKVNIPPKTKEICIGLQDYGSGKVWFDDVRADYVE